MNIGDHIPELLGHDRNGRAINAADYLGRRIVLYAYPKANTAGCTAEACSLEQHRAELDRLGYDIIGISTDKPAALNRFAEQQSLGFTLISDPEALLLNELGARGEKTMCGRTSIGTLRATFLVNEQGIVEHIFTPRDIKTKIHGEQVMEYIHGRK